MVIMRLYGCDVLLFGAMGTIGPDAEKCLVRHGLEVRRVDFPQNTLKDFSGYSRGLAKAVSSYEPRLVIPVGDMRSASRLKSAISSPIAVDKAQTIDLLSSKVRSSALCSELGVCQPRIYHREECREGMDLIFKRDSSFGGSGVHRPWTLSALDNLITHERGAPFLIEQYVAGQDVSIDCIRVGSFFRSSCYRSLARSQTQGPSAERELISCPQAQEIAVKILNHLDYQGVCGMDFRLAPDGKLYFLECNPRFTGGLGTQIEGGFDIPYLLWEEWIKANQQYL